jgi:hypothetical protein
MKSAKEQIAQFIKQDAILLAMLASNIPFNDKNGTAMEANSIIPKGQLSGRLDSGGKINAPIITIGSVSSSKLGHFAYDEIFDLTIYDDEMKSYVTIDDIIDRLREILDKKFFILDIGEVNFNTEVQGVGQDMNDPDFHLNFKKITVRLYII